MWLEGDLGMNDSSIVVSEKTIDFVDFSVRKKSGKPFKSGKKTAIVSGIIQKEIPSGTLTGSTPHNPVRKMVFRDFYTFSTEEEGYAVNIFQCEKV